jgi:hypothetical protein
MAVGFDDGAEVLDHPSGRVQQVGEQKTSSGIVFS